MIGKTLSHYKVIEKIGQGGMGEAKGVSDELRSLLATLNDPGADVVKVWQTLSPYAKKLVCQADELAGHLPDPNAVTADDFRRALFARLIRGERWVQGKRQRRRKTQIVGGRGRGRPADSDVDILVSILASGYAAATGKPTTKSWSLPGDPTDFERILVLVFSAVGLPSAGSTVKHALDRHMHKRRRLEEQRFQEFSEV